MSTTDQRTHQTMKWHQDSRDPRASWYSAPRECDYSKPGDDLPGIAVTRAAGHDIYCGTSRALAAAGIAAPDMFPGLPGRPRSRAGYRPIGGGRDPLCGWCYVSGYMTIDRMGGGIFRVARTIPDREFREGAALAWSSHRHALYDPRGRRAILPANVRLVWSATSATPVDTREPGNGHRASQLHLAWPAPASRQTIGGAA